VSASALGLLRLGVRAAAEADARRCLRETAAGAAEWETAVLAAERHGVGPLLERGLSEAAAQQVPDALRERLRAASRTIARNNLVRAGALPRVLGLLERERVPALPFKGPVLALQVHGDLGLRPFNDLDILVPPAAVGRAQHALSAAGFREVKRFADWQACWLDRDGRLAIDLHWRLTPPNFPTSIDVEALRGRAESLSLGGRVVPTLEREDLLFVLGVQLAKDAVGHKNRLIEVCDLAALVRTLPPHSLSLALERAHRAGAERMLLFGLTLVRNLLEIELPAPLAARLRRRGRVEAFGERVAAGFFDERSAAARVRGNQLRRAVCHPPLLMARSARLLAHRIARAARPLTRVRRKR
jgi:hypothetical protein